ncbi:MAG: phytoene/squalene synthase family protein [Thermomicrobiales bacterium]
MIRGLAGRRDWLLRNEWLARGAAASPGEADWDYCAEISRDHGRTFYIASHCLPPERRKAVHAVYAWCRIADDLADHATDLDQAAIDLDAWERQIGEPTHPVAVAFAIARQRYAIPAGPAHDLISGIRMDLSAVRFETWDDLSVYCYRVAGTVGLLVAPILGCREEDALPRAVDLGVAMQLTNILRDVAEDAQNGRLYLPAEDLARFGCDPEATLAGLPNGDFRGLIAFEIDRARALYRTAEAGFPALSPSGRLTAMAGSDLYSRILSRIEEMDYDVFAGRARVSGRRKLQAVPGIAATFARHAAADLSGNRP